MRDLPSVFAVSSRTRCPLAFARQCDLILRLDGAACADWGLPETRRTHWSDGEWELRGVSIDPSHHRLTVTFRLISPREARERNKRPSQSDLIAFGMIDWGFAGSVESHHAGN